MGKNINLWVVALIVVLAIAGFSVAYYYATTSLGIVTPGGLGVEF